VLAVLAATLSACFGAQGADYVYDGVTFDTSCVIVPSERLGQPIPLEEGPDVQQAHTIQGIATTDAIAIQFVGSPCAGKPASASFLSTSRDLTAEQEERLVDSVRGK
jgi:hypothetical protein